MREELEKKIFDTFPSIFKNKDLSPQETCMCWGLEVPDGWYSLIYNLCWAIRDLELKYGIAVTADQVKEKYGTLRFYHTVTYGAGWTMHTNLPLKWCESVRRSVVYHLNKAVRHINKGWWIRSDAITYSHWRFCGKKYTDRVFSYGWEGGGKVLFEADVSNRLKCVFNFYEKLSGRICQDCGTIGTFDNPLGCTQGWISYVCKNCAGDNPAWRAVNREPADAATIAAPVETAGTETKVFSLWDCFLHPIYFAYWAGAGGRYG